MYPIVLRWETARIKRAFPEDIKPDLQDISREFHLECVPGSDNQWDLWQIHSDKEDLQLMGEPGKSSISECEINNPYSEQLFSIPSHKHVMVAFANGERAVPNSVAVSCNREYGEVVLQPAYGPGTYFPYYLVPVEDDNAYTWPRFAFPVEALEDSRCSLTGVIGRVIILFGFAVDDFKGE